ncbi:ATP-binding protein [Aeromonas media]|uniref:ATP-binding protein n=1 Tax=Aeromonas media TaxID=651 RepID=UPI001F1FAFE9|nr:ATP-binding protein [Aeromonas media]MCE9923905.1 ATP-binding protein [Aeromonas media]
MPNTLFPILGTAVPPMLGRDAILQKMLDALTKPTPDHLQVVGPRFVGKTVILHELAVRLRQSGSPYSVVLLWDLGHQTPATDTLFMQSMARELSSALKAKHPEYAEHLQESQENAYQDIAEVLVALKGDRCKVLIIMDGFDRPLSNGQLTRNLWDQLRELAHNPSLRLVTASRRTLRDLIRQPDAQTSDFWNIFEPNPVRVGCFDEADLVAIQEKIPDRKFEGGAQTELLNAGNGFPVLTLSVLNAICEVVPEGTVSHEVVKNACDSAFPGLRDTIDTLWDECQSVSRDLFRRVRDEGGVSRLGVAPEQADTLIACGFVCCIANKLQRPSRLLCKYLEGQQHEGSSIHRLFAAAEAYQNNFKAVLEHRLDHFDCIDPTLKRYLERGAEELPEYPKVFLSNVRGIADQAFELIWRAELPDKRIPSVWMSAWDKNNEGGIDKLTSAFPQGVHRVRLLNLMTGTNKSDPCARYVTKGTYVLMNAVHAFGDFGQHQEGANVDPGTAYSILHLCIELAAALTRELPS